MKRVIKALAIGVVSLPLAAFAAGEGLLGTAHDFVSVGQEFLSTQQVYDATANSGAGGWVANATGNTVGLCSYCHTPHQALQTELLWNHTLSGSTFTWDVTKTAGGTSYANMSGATYKGPTTKCLSCHDGTVSIGDVALYKENGSATGAVATGTNNTFTIGGDIFQIASTGGSMKGNHPVGMAYPFGQAVNSYNSTTTGANVALTQFQSDPATVGGGASKIKLYNDTGSVISGGALAGKSGIECSSCHDPHNKDATDDLFLRGKIAGSAASDGYICEQCHIK